MDDPTSADPDPRRGHPLVDYPVVLDLGGWECLVVGGGGVGTRRAAGLLDAGGRVTVVAPDITESLAELAARAPRSRTVSLVRRSYRPGEAAGFRFVVTATGRPDVDATVVADAVAAGVLVTSAAGAAPGTVRLPAVHREGPVTLAVSTGATSPALAAWLRTRLAASLPPDLATIAGLLEEERRTRSRAGPDDTDWTALVGRVVSLVAAGRTEEARRALRPPDPPDPPEEAR